MYLFKKKNDFAIDNIRIKYKCFNQSNIVNSSNS